MPDSDTAKAKEAADISGPERLFGELRDQLLALSHAYAKSEDRSWESAEQFFSLSKKVDHLRREMLQLCNASEEIPPHNEERKDRHHEGATAAVPNARRRKSKKDYPKYAFRSGVLIKTGLGRDRRTEYEHAVQKNEFDKIVGRLSELTSKKNFVAEDVLGEVHCPSYQVYLVISLLKDRGLLVVPRRGFYAFRRPKAFADDAKMIWDSPAFT